jgi:hypothetical protein
MVRIKDDFLERISSLSKSLESTATKNTNDREHNKVARMLRNGLAVVSFAALEDFIKKRCSEVLSEVGRTSIAFDQLPEKLREASTYGVIESLKFQMSIREKPEKMSYVQEQAIKIASTTQSNFQLSEHIFGYDRSNVTADIIKRTLSSFHVNDPWREMSNFSRRLSLTSLPLEETYKSAAQRRHKAAHVASADTPESDLHQFISEAYAISITFDVLIGSAFKKIACMDSSFLCGDEKIQSSNIEFGTVKFLNGKWKYHKEGAARATKVSSELDSLLEDAKQLAFRRNELLVIYDKSHRITNWFY